MKKTIGYILLVWGIIAVFGLLTSLSNKSGAYLVGQIFGATLPLIIAYFLLRNKPKE